MSDKVRVTEAEGRFLARSTARNISWGVDVFPKSPERGIVTEFTIFMEEWRGRALVRGGYADLPIIGDMVKRLNRYRSRSNATQ